MTALWTPPERIANSNGRVPVYERTDVADLIEKYELVEITDDVILVRPNAMVFSFLNQICVKLV